MSQCLVVGLLLSVKHQETMPAEGADSLTNCLISYTESDTGQLPLTVNRKLGSVSSEGKTNQFTWNRMTNRDSGSTGDAQGKGWGITRGRNPRESLQCFPCLWTLDGEPRSSYWLLLSYSVSDSTPFIAKNYNYNCSDRFMETCNKMGKFCGTLFNWRGQKLSRNIPFLFNVKIRFNLKMTVPPVSLHMLRWPYLCPLSLYRFLML